MKLISERVNKKTFWSFTVILLILFVALMGVFTFYDYEAVKAVYDSNSFIGKLFDVLAFVVPVVSITALVIAFILRKRNKTAKTLLYVLTVSNFAFAMHYSFVQIVKLLWGRVRFVNLGEFTKWFIPNGPNGNVSFPSAHVSAVCAIGVLMLLCFVFNFKKWKKWVLCVSVFAFVLITAYSRITLGAHYPTDVIFSFFTAVVFYVIAVRVVDMAIKKRR